LTDIKNCRYNKLNRIHPDLAQAWIWKKCSSQGRRIYFC